MKKLAIFGGEPAFEKPKHVGRPNMVHHDMLLRVFKSVLESQWLTNNGVQVQQFEAQLCNKLSVPWSVAVANGTLGLMIAARALMPKLGEVIMPSFTFIATPHALAWQGYTPIFADIDPKTHVLDPIDVEKKITDRTVGILGVHVWGTPCAPKELTEIAGRHGLPLFFDAAHAFLCGPSWDRIGNYGACEVFSFHATKFFNSIEGGAITTNSPSLTLKLRELRNFGFAGDKPGDHSVYGLGINAKLSELHAAVGVMNLTGVPTFIDHNYANFTIYSEGLDISGIRVYPLGGNSNYQYVVIEVLKEGLSADTLAKALWAENILARRYFSPPCHEARPYSQRHWELPRTEEVASRTIVLPTGMAMNQADVARVCEVIRHCVKYSLEISKGVADNG